MLTSLPPEVLEKVVALLLPRDTCSLLLTSVSLYNCLSHPRFWSKVTIR